MKKIITIIAAMLALSACNPSASEVSYPIMPPEIKDCKVFLINNGIRSLYVVRCPNSSTSTNYTEGKNNKSVTLVDG